MLKQLKLLLLYITTVSSQKFHEPLSDNITPFEKKHIESNFYIALHQNNTDFLTQELLDISNPFSKNYGNYYSKDMISKLVTPNNIYRKPVLNWLAFSNLTIVNDNGDSLYVKGNLNSIEKALNVKMLQYKSKYNILYRSIIPYEIPFYLEKYIVFIEGISNPIYKKGVVKQISKSKSHIDVDDNSAGKESIYEKYNITNNLVNYYNSSICSIEYQGQSGFSQDDLQLNQQLNNHMLSNISHIVGINTYPDMESQLDMQMMGNNILTSNTDIWFWDETNWLYSLAVNMSSADIIPDIISMSWGWREDEQCTVINCTNITSQTYIHRVNIEYIKLGLRGISIVTASGDAGAPGRTNEGCMNDSSVNAIYPGASPWVTSVGGTFIVANNQTRNWETPLCKDNGCFTGTEERVTNYNYVGWTSGGGFSKYTNRSTYGWQVRAVNDYLSSGVPLPSEFAKHGRAYPDVSMVGHSCPVIIKSALFGVDGTSCSSPLFATVISILNEYQLGRGKRKLGFASPLLYAMYYSNFSVFNDITQGNNSCTEYKCCDVRDDGGSDFGYLASDGYDPVYGLGTPNVQRMKEWLEMYI